MVSITRQEFRMLKQRLAGQPIEGSLPPEQPAPVGHVLCRVTLGGEPVPKGRPRVVRRRGAVDDHIVTFTPKETRLQERHIREMVVLNYPRLVTDTQHSLGVRCYFACASNQRRDIDNLVKLVLDALNGLVWEDDTQVSELHATMDYGQSTPLTCFEVFVTGPRPTAVRKRRASKAGTRVLQSRG